MKPVETQGSPETYNIRRLDDGTFVLQCMGDKVKEYSYDTVEDLLEDLTKKLGAESEGGDDMPEEDAEARTGVKKIYESEDDEE